MGVSYRQPRRPGPLRRALGRRHGAIPALILAAVLSVVAADAAVAQSRTGRGAGQAAANPPPNAAQGGVAASMGPPPISALDRLTTALDQIGMKACAPSVRRAAQFLFEDGEVNFVVQPLGPDANQWPTVVTIEGAHAAMGRTRLATLVVAPGPGCSGFYTQTIYWAQPCDVLKRTVFEGFAGAHPVLRAVQASELNPAVQLYLMPAGAGCVSVKKEMFH